MGSRTVSAAALSAALAFAAAAQAQAAPGGESSEWLQLDREIEALAASRQDPLAPGVTVGAVLRTNFAWFEESPDPTAPDYAGFALDNVRPRVDGRVGDFGFQIEIEAQSGTALLLDGYGSWNVTDWFDLVMGRFQPPVLRGALVDPENLLFILRTAPDQFFQRRDDGVQLSAAFDAISLRASLENGGDGAGDEYAYTVRADWNMLGGGVRLVEGAYGSGRKTCLSLGASYHADKTALEDGDVIAADLALTADRFSASGEVVRFPDDGGVDPGTGLKDGIYGNFSDTTPWALTASFMVDPEKYELAARYESLDDINEVTAITLGLNRYFAGHDAKWVLNYAHVKSDLSNQDGSAVALGLTVNI